jgi:hypothetical protein
VEPLAEEGQRKERGEAEQIVPRVLATVRVLVGAVLVLLILLITRWVPILRPPRSSLRANRTVVVRSNLSAVEPHIDGWLLRLMVGPCEKRLASQVWGAILS